MGYFRERPQQIVWHQNLKYSAAVDIIIIDFVIEIARCLRASVKCLTT